MMYCGYGALPALWGRCTRTRRPTPSIASGGCQGYGYHVYSAQPERHWVWMVDNEFDWMPNADAAVEELSRIMDEIGAVVMEGYGS